MLKSHSFCKNFFPSVHALCNLTLSRMLIARHASSVGRVVVVATRPECIGAFMCETGACNATLCVTHTQNISSGTAEEEKVDEVGIVFYPKLYFFSGKFTILIIDIPFRYRSLYCMH